MSYNPLISIIIPVYNGSNYLQDAIESAISQTYKNFEILVVNDGSNDNGATEKIALSYGDKIRYFCKENGGVASALNVGIKEMNGEYFSWLSHDDRFISTKLEDQLKFLNEIMSKDIEISREKIILCGGTERIDLNGNVTKAYSGNINGKKLFRTKKELIIDNLKQYGLSGCTTLIPKEVFSEFGTFDVTKRTVQDTDLWYRFILGGCVFCFQDKALVQNREHKDKTGNRLSDVFEVEKEELQAELVQKMIKDKELNDCKYLSKISNYLLKMNYKKSPKIIWKYIREKQGFFKRAFVYKPCYIYSKLYGCFRAFAKKIYWRKVNAKES